MLKYIFYTVLLTLGVFTAVIYTGCTKEETTDKCAGINCKYGTCVNGICNCNQGYTGTLCDKRLCEANNTAKVRFINKTGSSLTYSVVWDGSTLVTLSPGQTSDYYEVAASTHTLHFMIANGGEACTQSSPVLVQCNNQEFWCTK